MSLVFQRSGGDRFHGDPRFYSSTPMIRNNLCPGAGRRSSEEDLALGRLIGIKSLYANGIQPLSPDSNWEEGDEILAGHGGLGVVGALLAAYR